MKKQLLLLALTLGTQISAETVLSALGELGEEYLTTIDTNLLPFQKIKLKKLTTLLQTDVIQVTDTQLDSINSEIDFLFGIVSQRLEKTYRGDELEGELEDLTALTNLIKEELPLAIQEAIQEAALQRLAKEAAFMAQQAPVISFAETDALAPNPIVSTAPAALHMNPQLAKDLSSLDKDSSSDSVDSVFLNHGDILEDFIAEGQPNLATITQEEYKDALDLFFKNNGREIDYGALSEVADRLYAMQKPSQLLLLANELRILQESSSSDSNSVVNTILSNHGNIFEDFMNETDTEENYPEALRSFLNNLSLKTTDYRKAVPKLAARLLEIQKPALDYLKKLDEESSTDPLLKEDIDTLLTALTPDELAQLAEEIDSSEYEKVLLKAKNAIANSENSHSASATHLKKAARFLKELDAKATQGLDPVQQPSSKEALAIEKKNRNKSTRNYHVRRNFIMQGNASEFMKHAEVPFREYITIVTTKNNGQRLNKEILTELLTRVLTKQLGLEEKDYITLFPTLMEKLVALEDKMWLENHPVTVDSSAQDVDVAQLPSEEDLLAPEQAEQYKKLFSKVRRELKRNNPDSAGKIINLSRQDLESLIRQAWAKNGDQFLDESGCGRLLVQFLSNLGLKAIDYRQMLPQLAEKLMSLQDEMLASNQPEVDPITGESTFDQEKAYLEGLRQQYASEASLFSLYDNGTEY